MSLASKDLREEIVEYCLQSMRYGLNFNTQGNISVRLPEHDAIVVTPTDLEYDKMTPDDLVVVGYDGTVLEGDREPSSEVTVHQVVHRRRPGIGAVVHSEPPYSNVFGALGRPVEGVLVNMIIYTRGPVPVMPFQQSNNTAFGEAMCDVMGDLNAVIWGNHGLLTVGPDLREAFKTSIAVESAARVQQAALAMGGTPHVLSYDDLGLTKAL